MYAFSFSKIKGNSKLKCIHFCQFLKFLKIIVTLSLRETN